MRPFRFGVLASMAGTAKEWAAKVRRFEDHGYHSLLLPDHLDGQLGPLSALGAAAAASDSLRLGTLVLNADLRHPALLAKEAATIDLLSDGRFELGLGAGWDREEYELAGLTFPPGRVRVERLGEAVRAVRALLDGPTPTQLDGAHYPLRGLTGHPRPVQRRIPLMIGGGRPRILRMAAEYADIIGVTPRFLPEGVPDFASMTAGATARRMDFLREIAGSRLADAELTLFLEAVDVTRDAARATGEIAQRLGLSAEEVLDSPYVLVGSPDSIAETILARRAAYGFSYLVVFEAVADAFAEVIPKLSTAPRERGRSS